MPLFQFLNWTNMFGVAHGDDTFEVEEVAEQYDEGILL